MGDLRLEVAKAAIQAYVHPGGDALLQIVRAENMGEASRRQVLLSSVVNSNRDALDQMRATRQDQQFDKANLVRARQLADDRRKAAADQLAELQEALSQQNRLKSALDTRIEEFTAEVEALSREEATLSALIRSRQLDADAEDVEGESGRGVSDSGLSLAGRRSHHVRLRQPLGVDALRHRHRSRLRGRPSGPPGTGR